MCRIVVYNLIVCLIIIDNLAMCLIIVYNSARSVPRRIRANNLIKIARRRSLVLISAMLWLSLSGAFLPTIH